MKKSRIDWVVKVNTMIIDGDQIKPQIFSLKNGKEIHSTLFAYGNGLVHGTDVKGNDFKFSIKDLAEIKPLKNWPPAVKTKSNTYNKDEADSAGENTSFEAAITTQVGENEENFDHPLLQTHPTGT